MHVEGLMWADMIVLPEPFSYDGFSCSLFPSQRFASAGPGFSFYIGDRVRLETIAAVPIAAEGIGLRNDDRISAGVYVTPYWRDRVLRSARLAKPGLVLI